MIGDHAGPPSPLDALVSPDVGVIHRVDPGVTQYDHPRLVPTFAQACDTRPLIGTAHPARAGAMDDDPVRSRLAALGEAVERYSAACVPSSRLRHGPIDELGDSPRADPDWLNRTRPHGPVRWVAGSRLRACGPAEPAWVAASRAYLSEDDEAGQIAVPTSTGLACHPDPWRALRSALLEVIERDAVMITWLTRAAVTTVHSSLRWAGRRGNPVRFDRAIERYELFRLASPTGVPVAFAVAFGAEGQPGAAVGAAAHPDLARAGRKALVEAHQTLHWAAHMMAGGRGLAEGAELLDLDAHVAYYLDHAHVGAFDFLHRPGGATQDIDLEAVSAESDPEADCRELVASLSAAGLDSFAVDVTAPEARAAGLWVIRAVVPGLYPLLVGTDARPDHPRLPASAPVHPDPHPFP